MFSLFAAAIFASLSLAAAPLPSSVTVWTWPLASTSPAPLATINYDPSSLNTTTVGYTPPTDLSDPQTFVRVGLYDPELGVSSWTGSATTSASFDPKAQHQISLSLDKTGAVQSVSFHAFKEDIDPREERRRAKREARQKKREEEALAKGKVPMSRAGRSKKKDERAREQPMIEIVKVQEGKRPVLNKPVVLNEQGKVEGPPEKTFLQKYWWAIAIFLVLQLVAGGAGGADEKK